MAETYYDVLGVGRDASQDEIEDAYREKVKETHPDVSDAPDASERFREVTRAEEVLGNADERARYDRLGHDAYVRHIHGGNAAGTEQSPWTAEREDAADATNSADSTDSNGSTDPSDAAEQWATDEATGFGSDDGTATDRREDRSTAGERGATAAGGQSRSSRRQQFYRERTGREESSSYAVRDWGQAAAREDRVRVPLTPDRVMFLAGMLFLYPVMVASTFLPAFPLLARLVVGGCTLLVTGYLLTVPPLGTVLFGVWSVLAPLGVVALSADPFSLAAVAAVGGAWSLFAFAVGLERALSP